VGRTKGELLSLDWRQYSHPDEIEEKLYRLRLLIENKINGFSMEKRYIRPGGEEVWVNITITSLRSAEFEEHCHLCMIEDITSRKKAEEEVLYLSYYDQLTGLYNRRFYEEELKRINTSRNLPITLVLADVNGLKLTNDAFGIRWGTICSGRSPRSFKKECRTEDVIARIEGTNSFCFFENRRERGTEDHRADQQLHFAEAKGTISSAPFPSAGRRSIF
jgi:PAS domain S-box-containing protein